MTSFCGICATKGHVTSECPRMNLIHTDLRTMEITVTMVSNTEFVGLPDFKPTNGVEEVYIG